MLDSMGKIEWTRTSPDDIEEAISLFICRMNPRAFRVRASRGDGGIDVCVPTAPNHFEVYQVKRFAFNLNSSQKRQAANSYRKMVAFASVKGWTIDRWYLTLPLDPTKENLVWLASIEKGGTIPCEWRGLSHVDGWAASFPDVVDYYFHNGRQLLNEELARFTAISGIRITNDSTVNPDNFSALAASDVANGIAQLRETLNTRDPHYSYDFSVTGAPPADWASAHLPEGLAARSSRSFGGSYVTFDIYARCDESLNERPIRVSMTLEVESGSVTHQELQEFFKYGRAPKGPIAAKSMKVEMPGGLGVEEAAGRVFVVEPDLESDSFERYLDVLSPDGELLATVLLKMHPPMKSFDGKGLFNRGTDRTGVFELETLTVLGPPLEMTMRFTRGDIAEKYPDEVEPALALLNALHAPNRLMVRAVRGAARGEVQVIPPGVMNEQQSRLNAAFLSYVRALAVIQSHTDVEIRIPTFETLDDLNGPEVLRAAQLLEGEVIQTTWDSSQVVLDPDSPDFESPCQIVVPQELTVTIGGKLIDLGFVRTVIDSAEVDRVDVDPEGNRVVTLKPQSEQNSIRFSWMGPTLTADEDH